MFVTTFHFRDISLGYFYPIELGPRCDDAFWFTEDEESGLIRMDSKRVEDPQSTFCIGFHQDGNLSVQGCNSIDI